MTLPEDYRGFLSTSGESGAGPYYGLYRLSAPECADEEEWRPGFLSTPFPERGRIWFDDRVSDGGISPCGTGFREWYREWLDRP